jgi:hypothetical protein
MAFLSDLPTELISLAAQHLVTPGSHGFKDNGIRNLRLTCRSLCLKSQHEFGEAAFSTFMLDLHPTTLQRWSSICKRPAFGRAVKKMTFAHSGDEHIMFPPVQDDESGRLEEQVGFVLDEIFKVAFSAMPNLKEIIVFTPFLARFVRGSAMAMNDTFQVEECRVTMEMLYILVTKTIADTQVYLWTLRITRLRTSAASAPYPYGVSVRGHPSGNITGPGVHRVLEVPIYARENAYNIGSLGQKVTSMPGLTHLDISFHSHPPKWPQDRDSAVAKLTQSLQIVHFPQLSFLSMRNITVDQAVLRDFLRAHQFI